MNARVLVSSLAVLALPACIIVNNPPPRHDRTPQAAPPATTAAPPAAAPPAYQEPPAAPPPVEQSHGIAEGHPNGLRDGALEAYWVWHDGGGWHVRTTTRGAMHRFQGRVWGYRGEVGAVHPTRVEWNDRFRKIGNELVFDFHTAGFQDGFDFQIAEGDCVQLYLLLDGKPAPDRVFIGPGDRHPSGPAFRLCH